MLVNHFLSCDCCQSSVLSMDLSGDSGAKEQDFPKCPSVCLCAILFASGVFNMMAAK